MKDNSDYSERTKIQLKRMLDKTTKYLDNNERGVGIKTVSLKRNYRESYPSEGKEEELVRDKQAFNEKQNKNNFQDSMPSSNEVNQQNKQEKYVPSTAKTDFEKGYLTRGTGSNHLLELQVPNEYEKRSDDVVTVPLLGKVTAGNPIEAIEVPDEVISLPSYLLPKRKEVFTIRVEGDSMINVGIYDKDIVIVQKQSVAKNGEIVVAMTEDNEVTLKTFYKEIDHIRLQPENDSLSPIILPNCTILGKAIGLYRKI